MEIKDLPTAIAEAISAPSAQITAEATAPKKRGRKPLAPEERARRRAAQQEVNRKKQEARRKALAILSERHTEEFEQILKELDSISL